MNVATHMNASKTGSSPVGGPASQVQADATVPSFGASFAEASQASAALAHRTTHPPDANGDSRRPPVPKRDIKDREDPGIASLAAVVNPVVPPIPPVETGSNSNADEEQAASSVDAAEPHPPVSSGAMVFFRVDGAMATMKDGTPTSFDVGARSAADPAASNNAAESKVAPASPSPIKLSQDSSTPANVDPLRALVASQLSAALTVSQKSPSIESNLHTTQGTPAPKPANVLDISNPVVGASQPSGAVGDASPAIARARANLGSPASQQVDPAAPNITLDAGALSAKKTPAKEDTKVAPKDREHAKDADAAAKPPDEASSLELVSSSTAKNSAASPRAPSISSAPSDGIPASSLVAHAPPVNATQPRPHEAASQDSAPLAPLATDAMTHTVPRAHVLPEIQSAKLLQAIGQSEMRVGLQSHEFGNISIRTSASSELISAQISLEHDGLARALSTHLPELQVRGGKDQAMDIRIHTNDSASVSGGLGNQSNDRQDRGGGQPRSSGRYRDIAIEDAMLHPAVTAHSAGLPATVGRIDIRA